MNDRVTAALYILLAVDSNNILTVKIRIHNYATNRLLKTVHNTVHMHAAS